MDEKPPADAQPEPKRQDLYTRHVESFAKAAEQDLPRALERYGFTVWHSLPPKEAAVLKERLGIRRLEALDFYNRGTAHAQEGLWREAEADLRAALKADHDYAPAAFNLAVCFEKEGRLDDARDAYKNYLKILDRVRDQRDRRLGFAVDSAQETTRVQAHLDTLGKA